MSKKAKETRSRGWCFTVQNYDDDDLAYVSSLFEDNVQCTYLIIGFEHAPRTGTPHLQCYIYYTNAVNETTMMDLLYGYHFEPQKAGKNVKAYVYCMEEYEYIEYGERPRQGHRTDLEVIKHDMHNGRPMTEISKEYFSQWCQYRRAFDDYKTLHKLEEKFDTSIVIYSLKHNREARRQFFQDPEYSHDCLFINQYDLIDFWYVYYSGKYKYVFVHSTHPENEEFQHLKIHDFIGDEIEDDNLE